MRRMLQSAMFLLVAAAACGQGPPKPATPASRPAAAGGQLELPQMRVDLKKGTIVIDAEVCSRTRIIEYLLLQEGGREYEALLRTRARAAHLHAALLAFGLTPGKPARWVWDGQTGRYVPPRGPALRIQFRWLDKQTGKPRQVEASAWLKTVGKRRAVPPQKWIFLGSEVLPDGSYRGDVEEVLIGVVNDPAAVIDVPFESSKEATLQEIVVNEDVVPPAGTPVQVIITPLPDGPKCPHARIMVEIDRNGEIFIKGRRFRPDQLQRWAEDYVDRHSAGAVLIRSDARAYVCDIDRVRDELKIGGVYEFDEQRLMPDGIILPRSDAQCAEHLAAWAAKFANPRDEIVDPGEQAKAALAQLEAELELLDDRRAVLAAYGKALRTRLGDYQAARRKTDRQK